MVERPVFPEASPPEVVVLGGGISGIAAALDLRDRGYAVTLVEARRFLGGRAFSFDDAATGLPVDNGQHVIVGSCRYFLDFLERLGVRDRWYLQPRLRLRILDRQGRVGWLSASRLPAPFQLLPALLSYPHLSYREKLRALRALIQARFTDRSQPRLEEITFYQWLRQHGQSDRAVQNLWNLLVEATLNDNVREVSAAMGLMIVQDGMLQGYHSADVGYPRDGLLFALGEPARQLLENRGVALRLGDSVRCLLLESGKVLGVKLASGGVISGDYILSALPASAFLKILPTEAANQPWAERLKGLETSPIVNINLWYDRPVLEDDFCAFVDRPLQWVFNRSAILRETRPEGINGAEQHICISLSAAWQYIDLSREELAERFIEEMAEAFPLARDAVVKQVRVVKQRHATFRCLPGAGALRPGSRTPLGNLFLAGEWTDTGWPSTMEGAVRSGYNAARAIVEAEESGKASSSLEGVD